MDQYRLYFVGQDGERLSAFDFASADDGRAEAAARQFGCERGSELWCGGRRVSGWRPDPRPPFEPPAAANDSFPPAQGLESPPRERSPHKPCEENTRWRDWLS
jgi:hypothetical protein